jgi:hypothetical protein
LTSPAAPAARPSPARRARHGDRMGDPQVADVSRRVAVDGLNRP